MIALIAFLKKECLELLRTGKLFILMILFCLFGIMNPAIAKLTPWLMELMSEQLAENGMTIGSIEVNAFTSWTQFFKNMPFALIIFIVMFNGIFTVEYQTGTLINVITKGLNRWKILASKTLVMAVFWTFGYWISYAITYCYNAYFWDNNIVENIFFAAFGFYLLGLWLITVISLGSVFFQTASAVTLLVGAAFLITYLLGLISEIKVYSPSYLMESTDLLLGISHKNDYLIALTITIVWIVINIMVSVIFFNKKKI